MLTSVHSYAPSTPSFHSFAARPLQNMTLEAGISFLFYSRISLKYVSKQSDKDWEIGKVVSQITWNVLLKSVPGGETLVHDRPWQGASDNEKYQKERPRYAYSPKVFEGRIAKVVPPIEGDLTFFNSR